MDPFPFTEAEWERVGEVTEQMTNATIEEKEADYVKHHQRFKQILDELRAKYGEHPVLLETEADFTTEGPERSLALYQRAKEIALEHDFATYNISLWIARTLLDGRGDIAGAKEELTACQEETEELGDEFEVELWNQAMEDCEAAEAELASDE